VPGVGAHRGAGWQSAGGLRCPTHDQPQGPARHREDQATLAGQIMLSRWPGAGRLCEPVDLGSDDEVVAGQPPDGMGPERNDHASPGHGQLGMMGLPFGEQRDPGGEAEGIPEVAEGELPAEPMAAGSLPALLQVSVQRLGGRPRPAAGCLPGTRRDAPDAAALPWSSVTPRPLAQLPEPGSRATTSGPCWAGPLQRHRHSRH
jgi:hypothetical protein